MSLYNCLLIHYFSASQEGNYRTSAYEAINTYIQHATSDTITVVHNVAVTALQRMEQLLAMQVWHIHNSQLPFI
jgi:hypothetical protein